MCMPVCRLTRRRESQILAVDTAGRVLAWRRDILMSMWTGSISTRLPSNAPIFRCGMLAKKDGVVLIVDERVSDTFTTKGNDVEWMMYGWSILHCLPVGM